MQDGNIIDTYAVGSSPKDGGSSNGAKGSSNQARGSRSTDAVDRSTGEKWYCDACKIYVLLRNRPRHEEGHTHQEKLRKRIDEGVFKFTLILCWICWNRAFSLC